MISLNNEPCCVCGETRSQLVQETTYPEHGYPGGFFLRQCSGCKMLFNSPRLDDAELAQLYGRNYYFFNRPDVQELNRIAAMYARTVALVENEFLKEDRRILDVGSGRGYFPAVLKQLGWEAHGVEISSEAAEFARTRFKLDRIYTGTIEEYAASIDAKEFPLVSAIDVIEHVPSPTSFVKALARVVRPGGLLIIDTPNAAAYNIRVNAEAWKGFNPFHIFLFSIPNLRTLLQAQGFQIEQSFSYNNTPADRGGVPLKDRLRTAAISSARSAGLLGTAARAYFKMQSFKRQPVDIAPHVVSVVQQILNAPKYLTTPDAEETLAREATGDNIVVIARRISDSG